MPNYTKGTPHNTPPSRKGDITHLHSHESRFKSKGGGLMGIVKVGI